MEGVGIVVGFLAVLIFVTATGQTGRHSRRHHSLAHTCRLRNSSDDLHSDSDEHVNNHRD